MWAIVLITDSPLTSYESNVQRVATRLMFWMHALKRKESSREAQSLPATSRSALKPQQKMPWTTHHSASWVLCLKIFEEGWQLKAFVLRPQAHVSASLDGDSPLLYCRPLDNNNSPSPCRARFNLTRKEKVL